MLPESQTPWPPPDVRDVWERTREYAAWYSGRLTDLATMDDDTPRRMAFWQRRKRDTPAGTRPAIHVPLAADIAAVSSDLLFGKPPDLDAQAATDELADLRDRTGFDNTLVEAAEIASALGGVYLRPVWDTTVTDAPFVTVVHPDAAIPTFRYGRLTAVTFYSEVGRKGNIVWRHLEHHETEQRQWVTRHGLYVGTQHNLGVPDSLQAHPATANLPDKVRVDVPWLGVAYVPNMLPNREHRHTPQGRPDIQGSVTLLDALDETWSSWMQDLRLAKARIIVPESYLQHRGRGSGQAFDVDQELFVPLDVPSNLGEGARELTLSQFDIRTAEHEATMLALVERVVTAAGYAPQDFGLHIEGRAESGTALRLRRSRSTFTTEKKRRYWQPSVARTAATLLHLDRTVFGRTVPTFDMVDVVWVDEHDPQVTAATVELASRATAVSVDTKVRWLHPDWSDDDVDAEVQRIKEENGMSMPDLFTMGEVAP